MLLSILRPRDDTGTVCNHAPDSFDDAVKSRAHDLSSQAALKRGLTVTDMHPKLFAVVEQYQVEETGHAHKTTWPKHQTNAEQGCSGDELEQSDGPNQSKQQQKPKTQKVPAALHS